MLPKHYLLMPVEKGLFAEHSDGSFMADIYHSIIDRWSVRTQASLFASSFWTDVGKVGRPCYDRE